MSQVLKPELSILDEEDTDESEEEEFFEQDLGLVGE